MINLEKVLKNLEFNEKDFNNAKTLFFVIENHGYEVIDNVIAVLAEDPDIVKILQENNLSIPAARDAWFYWLKLIFSANFDENFVKKVSHIGMTHVDAGVKEDIVIQTTSLFYMKLLDKLSELGTANLSELSISAIKIFSLSLVIMLDSYREELINSFLEFTGMERNLFEREVKIQRKKRKE